MDFKFFFVLFFKGNLLRKEKKEVVGVCDLTSRNLDQVFFLHTVLVNLFRIKTESGKNPRQKFDVKEQLLIIIQKTKLPKS